MFREGASAKVGPTAHCTIVRYLRRDSDGEDVYLCVNPINGRQFEARADLLRRYSDPE